MTCPTCGGFKPEPGRAYGYSGKLCYCSHYTQSPLQQSQYTESQEMIRLLTDILEEAKRTNDYLRKLYQANTL